MTALAAPNRSVLRVELLGSGGYHPTERRHTACVFLPELGLVLDAGTGAFRLHQRAEALTSNRLDVVLTHGHIDHIVGLTYLFWLHRGSEPVETVVHATPETLAAVREHLLAPALFPISPVTRYETLSESLTLASGARLTTFELDHPGGSVGLRIDHDGVSIGYVTDTRPIGEAAIEAIRGVDLLLHEAYFDASQAELAHDSGHCTAAAAARTAVAAGAKRLVMMHFNPRASEADEARALAEAREVFPTAEYGCDGMVMTISR
ncbi:MBL fold metallo-hydrolase [Botrimarina mediterranea]|uniref:Ribonuclease BN n=1 Tax=Botrimarina mediterranea TaxID=2528022 RepID=A0A518KDV7_9BACT|nr:MBL fold metallo-hydrolase [Botrimarina mediterranea]QDV75977.1 Ribonuclease BN [Botrimarina mediterranea]QDV80572.1 Ribonuclease BN [Planctomycetes bacterium K2D]